MDKGGEMQRDREPYRKIKLWLLRALTAMLRGLDSPEICRGS